MRFHRLSKVPAVRVLCLQAQSAGHGAQDSVWCAQAEQRRVLEISRCSWLHLLSTCPEGTVQLTELDVAQNDRGPRPGQEHQRAVDAQAAACADGAVRCIAVAGVHCAAARAVCIRPHSQLMRLQAPPVAVQDQVITMLVKDSLRAMQTVMTEQLAVSERTAVLRDLQVNRLARRGNLTCQWH